MRNIHLNITALMAIGMTASALTACSDNDLDSPATGTSRITFAVKGDTQSWNKVEGSRSGVPRLSTVTEMAGPSGSLFLIGERIAGIDSKAASSRAAAVTDSTIADFGVFAAMTANSTDGANGLQADYMHNVEVTRANGWEPALEYLWPSKGYLHINAFSPFTDAVGEEGVTALPATDETGGLTLDYRVPLDPVDQSDLMWASPVNASSSPCALTFNHALTAVKFVAGAQLAPCTVTRIAVSGVNGKGTLNIETGEWSNLAETALYEVTPATKIEAAEGSQYVEPETPLAPDEETLMLIPQTLPQGASVTLTLDIKGTATDFTADISGAEWLAGTTMIYRLSASAGNSDLILEVLDSDGNRVSSISSPYNGKSFTYTVNSYCTSASADSTDIEWDAELLDASGNSIADMPGWIRRFTASGKGSSPMTLTTRLPVPTFLSMSPHTKVLRDARDINTISGATPYNLAGKNGAPAVENTANCYLINASGHYSIPLVYGNAIKDGASNEAAYTSTIRSTTANKRKALFTFINHLGNEITDPYIYNNADCEPADARLVWEERLGIVSDVTLSADGHNLEFNIPADYIRQGNAVVAVYDASGQIMWSWNLWITDYVAGTDLHGVDANGTTGYLYPINLGRIYGGDETEFEAATATLRLTQKNVPDGMTPLTLDIALSQAGTTIVTNDCCSFYQWGRKDPMIAAVESYYNSEGEIMDGVSIPTVAMGATHKDIIEASILNPGKFISGTDSGVGHISPFYQNLWDINNLATSASSMQPDNVKTIYDPCPVGAKVPVGNEFRALGTGSYDAATNCKTFQASDGSTIMLNMFGYRELSGHDVLSSGIGAFWTAISAGGTRTLEFVVNQAGHQIQSNDALFGFAVRPVAE